MGRQNAMHANLASTLKVVALPREAHANCARSVCTVLLKELLLVNPRHAVRMLTLKEHTVFLHQTEFQVCGLVPRVI